MRNRKRISNDQGDFNGKGLDGQRREPLASGSKTENKKGLNTAKRGHI